MADKKLLNNIAKLVSNHGPHAVFDALQHTFFTLANSRPEMMLGSYRRAYAAAATHILNAARVFHEAAISEETT